MSSIAYIPKSMSGWCDQAKLSAIYACAYDAGPVSAPSPGNTSGPKTNHWVFYCNLAEEEGSGYKSIRLEPTPSGPNLSVVLLIAPKAYTSTNSAAKTFLLSTKDITFGQLMALIVSKGFDKYRFTPGGQGCRYWIFSVTKLLKEADLLSQPADADHGLETLAKVWIRGGQQAPANEQTGIQAGEFF